MYRTAAKFMLVSVIGCLMLVCGQQTVNAQEELMDGLSFNTTQVVVRLSGPWSTNADAMNNVMTVAPGGGSVSINVDGNDGLFNGATDWRENKLPMEVEAGAYLWGHVFLNIVSPQIQQINTASPGITLPILYNLGEGLQFNILEVANTPQANVDYIGPNSGPGFSAFPGTVTLNKDSNTELSLMVNRTGNVARGVYHVASIKFQVQEILEGGSQTRVEVTPAAWMVVGRVDQPDRIADAVVKRPAPQYVYKTDVKIHLMDLANVQTEEKNDKIYVTKTTTLSSQFLREHLGWNSDNDVPTELFPFMPYQVSLRDPLSEGGDDWLFTNYHTEFLEDINGDGLVESLDVAGQSVYDQSSSTIEVSYTVSAPIALSAQLTDFVSNLNIRAMAYFFIHEAHLPTGIIR